LKYIYETLQAMFSHQMDTLWRVRLTKGTTWGIRATLLCMIGSHEPIAYMVHHYIPIK